MADIRLVRSGQGRRYECFDCHAVMIAPFTIKRCLYCGESGNIHLMN